MRVELIELENNLIVFSDKGIKGDVNLYKVTFECPISKLKGSIKVVANSPANAVVNLHKAFKRKVVPIHMETMFV